MEHRVKKQKVTRASLAESLKQNLIRRKKKKSQDVKQKKLTDSNEKNPQKNIE